MPRISHEISKTGRLSLAIAGGFLGGVLGHTASQVVIENGGQHADRLEIGRCLDYINSNPLASSVPAAVNQVPQHILEDCRVPVTSIPATFTGSYGSKLTIDAASVKLPTVEDLQWGLTVVDRIDRVTEGIITGAALIGLAGIGYTLSGIRRERE